MPVAIKLLSYANKATARELSMYRLLASHPSKYFVRCFGSCEVVKPDQSRHCVLALELCDTDLHSCLIAQAATMLPSLGLECLHDICSGLICMVNYFCADT